MPLDRVRIPYAPPAHVDDYALIYTEHAEFGAAVLEAQFDATLPDLPIRRDEAAVSLFLQGAPAKITALYRRDREMVLRVRDMLRAALPSNLDLDEALRAASPVAAHAAPAIGRRRRQLPRHQGRAAPRPRARAPSEERRPDRPDRRRPRLRGHLDLLPRLHRLDRQAPTEYRRRLTGGISG